MPFPQRVQVTATVEDLDLARPHRNELHSCTKCLIAQAMMRALSTDAVQVGYQTANVFGPRGARRFGFDLFTDGVGYTWNDPIVSHLTHLFDAGDDDAIVRRLPYTFMIEKTEP